MVFFLLGKEKNDLPQIKSRHICLLPLLFRRYFNIKITFGERCVE